MTHLGLSTCFGAGAALLLQILVVSSESVKCSNPEVTYRDFYLSGNHNQTGVWKTSLGNVKVVIKHDGKPQMKAMGTGYWKVSVKLNSSLCGSSDTQDKKTIEEDSSPFDDNLFVEYPKNLNGKRRNEGDYSEYRRRSAIFGDRSTYDDGLNGIRERLDRTREQQEESIRSLDAWPVSNDGSDYDDGGDTEDHEAEKPLSDDPNELPLRRVPVQLTAVTEPAPGVLRMYPRPWVRSGWSTEYTDYGSTGVIKLFADSLPWRLAKERCEQDGGHLASVEDAAKVGALLDLFSKNPRVPRTAVLKNQVYVGINDRDEEGVFRTSTGDLFLPWNAILWAPNEPDDAGGAEDCVTFHTTGRIRDVPCGFSLPFFCELYV